jgi:hypothetical protein
VYTGCRDAKLYALDAATGREKWHFDAAASWVITSPAVAQGKVIFGTSDSSLYLVVDAKTGKEIVREQGKAYVFSSPAIAGNTVYGGVLNGTLEARDLASGELLWEFQTRRRSATQAGCSRPTAASTHRSFTLELARGADRRDGAPVQRGLDLLVTARGGRDRLLREHRRQPVRAGVARAPAPRSAAKPPCGAPTAPSSTAHLEPVGIVERAAHSAPPVCAHPGSRSRTLAPRRRPTPCTYPSAIDFPTQ